MSDRVAELEAKVAELSESFREMERRFVALEHALPPAVARRVKAAGAPSGMTPGGDGRDRAAAMLRQDAASVASTVSLAGRTLLVLAGAFLLRALTDAGQIPGWLGAGFGFVYAGVWIALADRDAAAGRRASAGFHGAAAVMIGFPLLFEATARFHLLPPGLAAALLAAFTAVALAVAVRRRFETLAWIVVAAALPAAYALALASGRLAAPLVFLVALGAATVWAGYVLDWHGPRWPVAAAADLAVLLLAFEAVRPGAADGPLTAILVQFALIAAYLGSTAVRTLGLRRSVVPFEMVQTAAILLAGLGGAAFVSARAGMGETALGLLSLAFGAAAYAVALAFVARERSPANFYFYATVALAFVLAGAAFLLPASPRALLWGALSLACAAGARRAGRRTLGAHAAVYAAAAALASGLLAHAADALFASPAEAWVAPTVASAAIVAAAAGAAWALAQAPVSGAERIPKLVLVAVAAAGAAGLVAGAMIPVVTAPPGAGADAGTVATVRTVVLAGGALALAALGRAAGWAEARWLPWPVLAVAGVKLLLEDLPRSRPATLFLAFAMYGAALILVPRLRRRAGGPAHAGARAG